MNIRYLTRAGLFDWLLTVLFCWARKYSRKNSRRIGKLIDQRLENLKGTGHGLVMRGLEGPSQSVTRGTDIILHCRYDLEDGDRLYAVKWFHGTREFYRFQPELQPPARFFPIEDVYVDVSWYQLTWRVLCCLTNWFRHRSSRPTPRNLSSAMLVRQNMNLNFKLWYTWNISSVIFFPRLQMQMNVTMMDGTTSSTHSSRDVGYLPMRSVSRGDIRNRLPWDEHHHSW